jgi:hypothetical protein
VIERPADLLWLIGSSSDNAPPVNGTHSTARVDAKP